MSERRDRNRTVREPPHPNIDRQQFSWSDGRKIHTVWAGQYERPHVKDCVYCGGQ